MKGKLEFVAPKVEDMKFDVIQDTIRGLTPLDTIDASLAEMKHISKSPIKVKYTKTSNYHNYKPKFVRAREFHSFLFYLTRDYDGGECSKDILIEDARRQGISLKNFTIFFSFFNVFDIFLAVFLLLTALIK